MYRIYWSAQTGAFVPEALLEECLEAGCETAYELVRVDFRAGEHRKPEYLALNPAGQIPALQLPDGSVMTESAAMVQHIADAHPGCNLAPKPGSAARAQFDRWLFFMVANLYETDLRVYHPERYTAEEGCREAVRKAELAWLEKALDIVERQVAATGGPFFLGETYSGLDPYLTVLVSWHPRWREAREQRPAIDRLIGATLARPAIARIWGPHHPESGGQPS